MTFSPQLEARFDKLLKSYPPGRERSAMIPMLMYAQDEIGCVSDELIDEVARRVGVTPLQVNEVLSYYSMLHRKPLGKYHIQVCTNISCALRGAAQLLEKVCEKAGVKPGQGPSADGLWSVEEVECLAGCGSGPCVQVNHDVYDEFVDEKKLLDVMEACKRGDYRPWAK